MRSAASAVPSSSSSHPHSSSSHQPPSSSAGTPARAALTSAGPRPAPAGTKPALHSRAGVGLARPAAGQPGGPRPAPASRLPPRRPAASPAPGGPHRQPSRCPATPPPRRPPAARWPPPRRAPPSQAPSGPTTRTGQYPRRQAQPVGCRARPATCQPPVVPTTTGTCGIPSPLPRVARPGSSRLPRSGLSRILPRRLGAGLAARHRPRAKPAPSGRQVPLGRLAVCPAGRDGLKERHSHDSAAARGDRGHVARVTVRSRLDSTRPAGACSTVWPGAAITGVGVYAG